MKLKVHVFVLVLYAYAAADAARILAFVPLKARSHFYFHEALFKTLATAGHRITLVNPYSLKATTPNFTVVRPPDDDAEDDTPFSVADIRKLGSLKMCEYVVDLMEKDCENIIRMPYIQNLLKSREKLFDLIFIELFFMYECYLPIADKFDVPIIGTFSAASYSNVDFVSGNPRNPATHAGELTPFATKMTFYERLQNTYAHALDYYLQRWLVEPRLRKFYQRHHPTFDPEKCAKISLIFLNGDPTFYPKPMVPSVVQVAGIHLEGATKQQLPNDIREFIESAEHGVILFSLGSIVGGSALEPELKAALRETFADLPQRVIWKIDEKIAGLTDNVLVSKWVPQREILAHPKVIALISHCGIASTYEAIFNGKPMILFPIFADQLATGRRLHELEVGILHNVTTVRAVELRKSLTEIVRNPKYAENMRRLSKMMRDTPTSRSQSIVYWTEYVLRHNGAAHLRTVAADMPLYQYLMVDVIAFLAFVTICTTSVLLYSCKKMCRILCAYVRTVDAGIVKKKR